MNNREFVNFLAKRLEVRLARAVNPLTDEQEEVERRKARKLKKKSGTYKNHLTKKNMTPRFGMRYRGLNSGKISDLPQNSPPETNSNSSHNPVV
jgi:hypothetical protein